MDVSRETPDVTTEPTCYDLTNISTTDSARACAPRTRARIPAQFKHTYMIASLRARLGGRAKSPESWRDLGSMFIPKTTWHTTTTTTSNNNNNNNFDTNDTTTTTTTTSTTTTTTTSTTITTTNTNTHMHTNNDNKHKTTQHYY